MRDIRLEPKEARRIPLLSLVFGFGPMAPFVAAAVAAWMLPVSEIPSLTRALLVWGGAILAFLAGVERGLSFRTAGGARLSQIVAMLGLFGLALFAILAAAFLRSQFWGVAALLVGYAGVGAFDLRGARVGEAPPFFARLRPVQAAIPVVCLAALAARLLGAG